MNIQKNFDNLSKMQKILLYFVAIIIFIFAAIVFDSGEDEIAITILFFDLIYFIVILFFEFKHFSINPPAIINTLNTMKKLLFYLIIISISLAFLIFVAYAVIGSV